MYILFRCLLTRLHSACSQTWAQLSVVGCLSSHYDVPVAARFVCTSNALSQICLQMWILHLPKCYLTAPVPASTRCSRPSTRTRESILQMQISHPQIFFAHKLSHSHPPQGRQVRAAAGHLFRLVHWLRPHDPRKTQGQPSDTRRLRGQGCKVAGHSHQVGI